MIGREGGEKRVLRGEPTKRNRENEKRAAFATQVKQTNENCECVCGVCSEQRNKNESAKRKRAAFSRTLPAAECRLCTCVNAQSTRERYGIMPDDLLQ
jgi:hypothetical protein